MKTKPPLKEQLTALSAREILELLALMQTRWAHEDAHRARETVLQRLLQARLARLMATGDRDNTVLTMTEVAKRLKVSKARAYELLRSKVLPAVRLGVRQVRVRQRDLDRYLQPKPR